MPSEPKLPLLVTTSGKLMRHGAGGRARLLAEQLGVAFVPCERNVAPQALLERADAVLVVRGDGVVLMDREGSARWAGGIADLRVRRIDDGLDQPDHVLLAGDVRPKDHVLDATLGLGQDALVLSRAVGPEGRVVALEKSLPLYAFTRAGLELLGASSTRCPVQCVHVDAVEYLAAQPTGSVDCVFFDPMFRKPAGAQPSFSLVRRHAETAPLGLELLAQARRVARRWVVVKAPAQGGDLARLGLTALPFRRSADLRFGRLPGVG